MNASGREEFIKQFVLNAVRAGKVDMEWYRMNEIVRLANRAWIEIVEVMDPQNER